ncbi:alpha/beta hydrolase [Phytohabitans sp. ZYX-F-186]|uniref:Alpha/beta hydrolase n=1 Tax=Phytohabitans maris TaxID=3071409 RepID=A0ABU0ZJ90_9ACTN|nr:alpha/beta hydrolase [Phytohabitans sp. ZYX-F-186]MDQ7907125.1 alpha/beta hydrolase [Phytohabitans sp. ZYX-F-186]
MSKTPQTVASADGTPIAYEVTGDGPPVILVGGALDDRTSVAALAATLASRVTAIAYDRRGRGGSGDNADAFAVRPEIEDLAALIAVAGGRASLFGHSSGGVLALEAAVRGLPVERLAVYEPPFVVGGLRPLPAEGTAERIRTLIAEERRDDAVHLFLTEEASVPAETVDGLRAGPAWPFLARLAHTLPYDVAVCGPDLAVPVDRLATVAVPTLTMAGGASPAWLPAAAQAVAEAIPGASYLTVEGQDHGVLRDPQALRDPLLNFIAPACT